MSNDVKDHILSPSQWLRIVFIVMYSVVCWVLGIVIICLVIGQALFSLITGKANTHLRLFARRANLYFLQILDFVTYCSDEKPFPFASFPQVDAEDEDESEDDDDDSDNEGEEDSDTDNIAEDEDIQALSAYDETSSEVASPTDSSEVVEPTSEEEPSEASDDESIEALLRDQDDDVFADISFTSPDENDDEGEKEPDSR